jgi:hypothetical protein
LIGHSTPIQRSGIRAVDALLKSVTMGPWPGAVPPDELLSSAYSEHFSAGLEEIIEDA